MAAAKSSEWIEARILSFQAWSLGVFEGFEMSGDLEKEGKKSREISISRNRQ